MTDGTLVERLARKWQVEIDAEYGIQGVYSDDQADKDARWWLRAIADEVERIAGALVADEWAGADYVARTLRKEANDEGVDTSDERVCANCGHAESKHMMSYWPRERMSCRVGGIIEPDDVGWQCSCEDFTPTQWATGQVECAVCGHDHLSVHPTCAERLECPECGYMTPNPDREGT